MAQPVPAPVTFRVNINGYSIEYDDTEVTNTRTGEKLTAVKVSQLRIVNGIGYFDLQEFTLGYQVANSFFNYAGDKLYARVCDAHPSCTFSFYITTRDPLKNTFKVEITDLTIPEEKYKDRIQCWDGRFVYDDESLCPVQPQPKPEPTLEPILIYVCVDGTKVAKASECVPPETEADQTIIVAITVVILALLVIWAWVKNTDLKGRYRWIPGMAGILTRLLEGYKKEKDKVRSEKLKQTILKYSITITEKYLTQIKK